MPCRSLREREGPAGLDRAAAPITERLTSTHHAERHPEAIRLWLRSPGGRLRTYAVGARPEAGPGDTLAALVPPGPPTPAPPTEAPAKT